MNMPSPSPSRPHWRSPSPLRRCGEIGDHPTGADFSALGVAYRGSGGLGRGDDVARLLADRGLGGVAGLGRLIERRQVFSVRWLSEHWLPLFQFDRRDFSTLSALQPVLRELDPVYGPWDVATWFVQPNDLLGGLRPLDGLATNPQQLVDVARGDRLIIECRRNG